MTHSDPSVMGRDFLDEIRGKAEEALRDAEAGVPTYASYTREPALARAVLKLARVAEAARKVDAAHDKHLHINATPRGCPLCELHAALSALDRAAGKEGAEDGGPGEGRDCARC